MAKLEKRNQGKNFSLNTNKTRNKKSDFYQTPYSMTRHLLDRESFEGTIFEPCCGKGAIVKVLKEHYRDIFSTDISRGDDFLKLQDVRFCNNIVTNPPYSKAKEFILKAKQIATKKIAMLLPLNYLHGIQRYKEIWLDKEFPLKCVYVFCRYPMLSEELREDGKYKTGMMVYAWYVWDKEYQGEPMIKWIDNNEDVLKS